MNQVEKMFWILLGSILLLIIFSSGCRIVQPVIDFIFVPPASSDVPVVIGPEGKLLEAIKGTNWLVSISILGMAAGVFAFINGSKIGIPVVVSCAVSLFMSLAVARFALWMALFGLIGAVAAVVISVVVKNRALKEVVGNVNAIKESVATEGNKKKICADIKIALAQQAKSTKKLVNKIRAKL